MFAVIKTGGKQYKVAKNQIVKVEKIVSGQDVAAGDIVVFDQVLAVGEGDKVTLGTPTVKDMKVSAEVLEQKRDEKVLIFKKRRRHNYRRKQGHRQSVVVVKIQEIATGLVAKIAPKAEKPKAEPKQAAQAKAAPKAPKAKDVGAEIVAKAEKTAAKKAPTAKKPASTAAKKPAAKKKAE